MSTFDGKRDPNFEREFLHHAERLAGMTNSGWANEVQARLHQMEREKGPDSYLQLGIRRCVREAGMEGLDIGGWPVVAALSAYPQVADVDVRHEVHLLLVQMASYGPLVREIARQVLELLDS